MAESQPATVESNIVYQFDVQEGPRPLGHSRGPLKYRCLLYPCCEYQRYFAALQCLRKHRKAIHDISEDTSLPTGHQISDWVALGKPRPYDVPGKPRPESQPATVESNIVYQFDVHEGPRPLGRRRGLLAYRCLLYPCCDLQRYFPTLQCLQKHRKAIHDISEDTILTGRQISEWVALGKPRPYDVPGKPSKSTPSVPESVSGRAEAAALQAATLDSNVYAEFDVRREGLTHWGYFCLLAPCHEEGTYLNSRVKWIEHRNNFHQIPKEVNQKLPNENQIDRWVTEGKPRPRPSDVSVRPRPTTLPQLDRPGAISVDRDIFEQVDIKVIDGKEHFFCLLDPCRMTGLFTLSRCTWIKHRHRVHGLSPLRQAPPRIRMFRDWIAKGKPLPYQRPASGIRKRRQGPRKHRQEPVSIEDRNRDLLSQFDVRKNDSGSSQYFCLRPGCKESEVFFLSVETLRRHRKCVHKEFTLEDIPGRRFLPGAEKRGKELGDNPDAARDAECLPGSSAAGPAQKKVRRSVDAANQEEEELVSYCDEEFAAGEDCDQDAEDVVDDRVVDLIPDYRTRLGHNTQMVEEAFGGNSLPTHASTQLTSSEESTTFQAEPLTPDPIHTARDLDLNVAVNEEFDLNVALNEEFDVNVALPQAQKET